METYFFEKILTQEINPIRFERFCCDLYSAVSGVTIVPTSKVYDRGRDGRAIGSPRASGLYLAATLNKDLDSKLLLDIERLKETSRVVTLVYCCSLPLTEDALDKVTKEITKIFSCPVNVEPLSAIQLADLAEKHLEIFKKHYHDDLECILNLKEKAGTAQEAVEQKGLRLALLSFACEDATALRNNLSKQLVLELLAGRDGLRIVEIAKLLSDELRLPKPINEIYIKKVLDRLSSEDLVAEAEADCRWSITGKGKAHLEAVAPEVCDNLLEGRNILFNGLYQLTGVKLEPDAFNRVWNIFQDYIAHLFYSNGLHTVQIISALLDDKAASDDTARFNEIIENLSDKIAAVFSDPEQAETFKQAVLDIFAERSGDAFQWLAAICSVFVSLCSLGLEGTSAEQIKSTLRKTKLVIDTDILISLLCDREPQHDSIVELLKQWRGMGGDVYVHDSVLKEAAYHAWISENDYAEVNQNLKDLSNDQEADRYIQNAFVRTFRAISGKNYGYRAWHGYISQFRGGSEYDFSKILEVCAEDFGIVILKGVDSDKYKGFIEGAKAFIMEARLTGGKPHPISQEEKKRIEGKSENDALLLASILQFRELERAKGSGDTLSLLSSSVLFLQADGHYSSIFGAPEVVLTLSAVSYLIALLPGAKYSIGSLKTMLFSFGRRIKLRPEERIAMRILKASSEHDLPFAKRAPLRRNLREALMKEAKKNGTAFNTEYDNFMRGGGSKEQAMKTAHILVEAVENIASFDTESEKKYYVALQELRRLKVENDKLKEELKEIGKK